MNEMSKVFDLTGRVAVITGGAGLLGEQHARAIASAGGTPILVDIQQQQASDKAETLGREYGVPAMGCAADITKQENLEVLCNEIVARFGRLDILINNAANNPKMEASAEVNFSRLENFPIAQWDADIAVGLTGAFLCSKVFGSYMAEHGGGVIVNVASDLARYLATYWADKNVRVNAISPGGVANNQPEDFVARLTNLIPLGRMADVKEYRSAILFLCSDASSYMTGTNLVVDGGRSCW